MLCSIPNLYIPFGPAARRLLSALICPSAPCHLGGSLYMLVVGFGGLVPGSLQLTVVVKSQLYANEFEFESTLLFFFRITIAILTFGLFLK